MSLKGQLSEYSLPELFQLLEQSKKTGALIIRIFKSEEKTYEKRHIYFDQGQVIALSDLSGNDLLYLIQEKNLVDQKFLSSLIKLINKSSLQIPIGSYLQSRKILDAQQIQHLFEIQVINPICNLFGLENAWFSFNNSAQAPATEMTGLSISPTKLSFLGLRQVQEWKNLSDKLPDVTSGLVCNENYISAQELSAMEEKVFAFCTGTISLGQIAIKLGVAVEEVQRVAFSLIATGLVEELPIINVASAAVPPVAPVQATRPAPANNIEAESGKSTAVNKTFLTNLTSFLKNKTAKAVIK